MEKLVIIGSGSGGLPIASTVAKFRKNQYDIYLFFLLDLFLRHFYFKNPVLVRSLGIIRVPAMGE